MEPNPIGPGDLERSLSDPELISKLVEELKEWLQRESEGQMAH